MEPSKSVSTSRVSTVLEFLELCILRGQCFDAAIVGPHMYSPFHSVQQPHFSLTDYLNSRIVPYTDMEPSDLVYSVILIRRLIISAALRSILFSSAGIHFSPLTCHRLCLTAALVTCKFQHDVPRSSRHWAMLGGVPKEELCHLERFFLHTLEWKVKVDAGEYRETLRLIEEKDANLLHPSPSDVLGWLQQTYSAALPSPPPRRCREDSVSLCDNGNATSASPEVSEFFEPSSSFSGRRPAAGSIHSTTCPVPPRRSSSRRSPVKQSAS